MNPSIRLPSKFLSLSSTFLRYRASGSSCFLRAINIVQPVSVANQFSRNVVLLQHVCKLFPAGRSGCCRSFPHQVIEQIDGIMCMGDNLALKNKLALGTPRYVWVVLGMIQKL